MYLVFPISSVFHQVFLLMTYILAKLGDGEKQSLVSVLEWGKNTYHPISSQPEWLVAKSITKQYPVSPALNVFN